MAHAKKKKKALHSVTHKDITAHGKQCDAAQKTHLTQLSPLQKDLDRCGSQLNSSKQVINIKTIDMWNSYNIAHIYILQQHHGTHGAVFGKKKNLC